MVFNPLHHPIIFSQPLAAMSPAFVRSEHTPFAMCLIELLNPNTLVVLGAGDEDIYYGFCQAVQVLRTETKCYAIEARQGGDEDKRTFAVPRAYHDSLYSGFSTMLGGNSDEALSRFASGTIDLLYLDCQSGNEAIQRDFKSWLPKMSARGIAVLSPINAEKSGSAARYWTELRQRYPHFEFSHGQGLGVLAIGDPMTPDLRALFEADEKEAGRLHEFFRHLGQSMRFQDELRRAEHKLEMVEQELAGRQHELELAGQRLAAAERLRKAAEERRLSIEPVAGAYLSLINSRSWRALQIGWRLKTKLVPAGSRRAKFSKRFAKALWRTAKTLRSSLRPADASNPVTVAALNNSQQFGQAKAPSPITESAATASAAMTDDYQAWTVRHTPSAAELEAQRGEARVFGYRPLISILTPLYQTPPAILAATIESVLRQTYDQWELCLVDASAPDEERQRILDDYVRRDQRIRLERLPANLGIAENTNAALRMAHGEFIALLDHDDELAPHALHAYVKLLNEDPETDIFYSDEDKLDQHGNRCHPFFKPDWSPEYFRGVMYVGHLLCFRRSLLDRAGQFERRFDGVQDFELMLRLSETTAQIKHVSQILYHWRQMPGSIAQDSRAKPNISELQRAAVNEHLARTGLSATAELASEHHRLRFAPALPPEPELVSIIIPSKDAPEYLENCLRTIFERSSYPNYEVIIVDNDTSDSRALEVMERFPVKRVHLPGKFNYSRANNLGVQYSRGKYLLFLNNDTEVVTPDWIEHMVYYGAQPDAGAVGALLLYSDRTVQHAGVILGPRGTADHLMRGFPTGTDGYAGSLVCAREASAVTAACLLMKRSDFAAIGGFSEHYFTHYQDVELCLRLRRLGKRNIFTPRAELIHHESKTRKDYYDFVDYTLLLDQWQTEIERGDPYYNSNFDLARTDYGIRQ